MDLSRLSQAQRDLLRVLLAADRSAREKSGRGDTFAWHSTGGMGPTYLLHRGGEDGQEVDPVEMEALIAVGILTRQGQRSAIFTPEGFRVAERVDREQAGSVEIDPSWQAMKPILDAFWTEWIARGAPSFGVSSERMAEVLDDDLNRVDRQLALLEEGDWLKLVMPGSASRQTPTYAPAPQLFGLLGGWPVAGETLARGFLAAVAAAADQAADPEERSRLQELAGAAARVSEGILAGVLTSLATGGGPHL